MSVLHLLEPARAHLLWLLAAWVILLVWLDRRSSSVLGTLVSRALGDRLVRRGGPRRRLLRIAMFGLSGLFMVIALVRPQFGSRLVTTPQVGAEIMIALDVSRSMLAEDAAPNRLERAKADIRDLLEYLDGDQVGLIAFAGRATVLAPLTPDFSFLRLVLDSAGPDSVTRGGTRLEEPIRKAVAGFGKQTGASRSILLITDGEDHDSFPLDAAKDAAEVGVKILAVGFGDENGSPIVVSDPKTGVKTKLVDQNGDVVISRLDGELLRTVALATDGAYVPAGTGVLDLRAIYNAHIANLTRGKMDGRTRAVGNDAFQWPLLLSLLSLIAAVVLSSKSPRPGNNKESLQAGV